MSNMESNKIIAEFMGISIDRELAYIEDEGSPLEEVMPVNNLNYHTSWDWLMHYYCYIILIFHFI